MKKLILLFLLSITAYGQADFPEGVQISGGQPVKATDPYITTTDANGLQGKVSPENIPITVTPTPVYYTPTAPNINGHLSGINNAIGAIPLTTAGNITRIWFTGDVVNVSGTDYYQTSTAGKGTVAIASQSVINDDNEKKYFTQDVIGGTFVTATSFPAGTYAGNLSVSTTPNSAQQRYTIELYRCNSSGTPIASGIPGAPVGDLGVTVVLILDSGNIQLADGSVTNLQVNGTLSSQFNVAVGERIRYHVSAAKVGTAVSNITESVWYGNSYNSYIDVPTPITSTGVVNLSTVTGANLTVALDNLNTGKANDVDVVHITGAEIITGQKTFNGNITASSGIGRGTYFNSTLTATANSDVLIGLDVNPNFSNGAFTNVQNIGIRAFSLASPTADILIGKSNGSVLFGSNTETYLTNPSASARLFFSLGSSSKGSFMPTTGNFILQDGGIYIDEGFRLDVKGGTSRMFKNAQSDVVAVNNSAAYIAGGDVGVVIGQYASSPNGVWMQSTRFNNVAFPLAINPNGGSVSIGSLAGTGTRQVVADANGNLSATELTSGFAHLAGTETFTGIKNFSKKITVMADLSDPNAESVTVIQNATAGGAYYIKNNANTNFLCGFSMANNDARFANYVSTGKTFFYTNGFDRISIFPSGNVQIKNTSNGVTTDDGANKLQVDGSVKMGVYTVATLPTGVIGSYATVTDALAPAYLTAVVGGGAVVCPVFYNGTTWVSH